MSVTYPPELLPDADEDGAEVVIVSERGNQLLAAMPFDLWTECEDGQICLQLARGGLCKYTRINATLGRFEAAVR